MRHPALLHHPAFHPDLGRDRGDLTGVVGLHAADRHQRVGIRRDRVGHDVFELAQLVAADRQAGIAIVALRLDLDLAAERAVRRGRRSIGVGPKVSG